MSSIMKGIVDESENVSVIYIDGKAAAKYANKHEAEKDAARIREKFPNKKIEIKQEVRETELDENLHKWFKEKWVRFGPDGKIRGACARGSDSEGKPKCLPQSKAHSLGKKGRKYAAAKKRREDPNPERHGKAINVATKKKKTNESIPFNECPECGGEIVHESMMNEKKDACYHKVKARYKVWPSAYASGALVQCRKKGASNWGNKSKANEGVIIGHDATDPDVAVLGGAGSYKLSSLKKKAQMEANELAKDIASGKFKNSAYNIKQLANTLNTIVAAEDEMEKLYFGEDYTGQFAAEKTPAVNPYGGLKDNQHRGAISEDRELYNAGAELEQIAAEMKELADNAMNLVRSTPEEGRARSYWYPHIVMAISQDHGYMGKNMFTMMDSAQNLMDGDEEEVDEAREPSDALRAAQKNLVDLSTGEVRRREQAKKAAAKRQREYDREFNRKPKKPTTDEIWRRIEHAISNYFPDGDPTDYLAPYMEKNGLTWDDITRAAKKNGYKDLWDYWNTLAQDIENDAYGDWLATDGKNVRQRAPFMETPTDNPTGASGEGGWRKYKPKSAGTVEEDTAYAGGMGQGHSGESYRKFKPKSAGTFKEEDELDEACWKGYHKEGMKTMFGKKYPNCVKNSNESAIMKGINSKRS